MTADPAVQSAWSGRWPEALAHWSRLTRLSAPRWCWTKAQEKAEGLTGSFAMIRLTDHAVVISLRQAVEQGIQGFPLEVMSHEIGHHVLCPGDLTDQGRLIARLRHGLPGKEKQAPLVANLYADLLINDRLQRDRGLRMSEIFATLGGGSADPLWTFYMRIYEILWSLPRKTLATGEVPDAMESDALLGARLVRTYARDFLRGAGRFACLVFAYLADNDGKELRRILRGWLDTESSADGQLPEGLAEMDPDELEGCIHPALDDELNESRGADDDETVGKDDGKGRELVGGNRRRYREPSDYGAILESLGVKLSESERAIRYYKELATPHLVKFPVREYETSTDPLPEGLDVWDVGSPIADVDWFESAAQSPLVIPGITTLRRTYGESIGTSPQTKPVDLYLGIDCSGSMLNPRVSLSYPVLAGAIVSLSALRAGARVWATLSGEPGKYVSTDAFVRDEERVLGLLTGYLGTGYTFGIPRLREAFPLGDPLPRKAHILIVTDTDIFMMLDQKSPEGLGWDVAREALRVAGGGGTYVLHMPRTWQDARTKRMQDDGWDISSVESWEDIVTFARDFSRRTYEKRPARTAAP